MSTRGLCKKKEAKFTDRKREKWSPMKQAIKAKKKKGFKKGIDEKGRGDLRNEEPSESEDRSKGRKEGRWSGEGKAASVEFYYYYYSGDGLVGGNMLNGIG